MKISRARSSQGEIHLRSQARSVGTSPSAAASSSCTRGGAAICEGAAWFYRGFGRASRRCASWWEQTRDGSTGLEAIPILRQAPSGKPSRITYP
jgi:hypothetical protein